MISPVVVISGPSGGGKSTILERAIHEFPGQFVFSVSYTTRSPRGLEQNGVHYFFVSRPEMEKMIEKNEFLEYAEFGGNLYGTSRKLVDDQRNQGKICVLDLEIQGVLSLKASGLPCRCLLIRPPSLEILEQRLRKRQTDSEEAIQKRLSQAKIDWQKVDHDPGLFDTVIINEDPETAYREFINWLREDLKRSPNDKID